MALLKARCVLYQPEAEAGQMGTARMGTAQMAQMPHEDEPVVGVLRHAAVVTVVGAVRRNVVLHGVDGVKKHHLQGYITDLNVVQ